MFPWILLATAQAQSTLLVPQDFETVQAAVIAASNGDTIEVDGSDIFQRDLDEDALVNKDLTIRGVNGRPKLPRLNLMFANVLVENAIVEGVGRNDVNVGLDVGLVVTGGSLVLSDVTLVSLNGNSAGIVSLSGDVSLDQVDAADFWSAPVVVVQNGNLDVANSAFAYNYAGVISVEDGDVSVTGTTFEGNYGYSGADIAVTANQRRSLVVDGCTFDFSTSDYGGAIVAQNADLTVLNSDFTDPWSWVSGGAIVAYSPYEPLQLEISNSTFLRGGSVEGGAITLANVEGGLISGSTFTNNYGDSGGAIAFAGGSLEIVDSHFSRNQAGDVGGAIRTWISGYTDPAYGYPSYGTTVYSTGYGTGYTGIPPYPYFQTELTLVDTSFDGRVGISDAFSGGCVAGAFGTVLTATRTQFTNCNADWDGGAITFAGNSLTIEESTLQDNGAFVGGALYQSGGLLTMAGTTLTGNSATFGGAVESDSTSHSLTGNWFTANTASGTSVVELTDAVGLLVNGNRFCNNAAVTSGSILQVIGASGGPFQITNNVWLFNASDLGASLRYVPSDWLLNNGPNTKIRNNDFVGNATPAAVAFRGSVDVTNNILVGQPIGVVQEAGLNGTVVGGYNLWLDNGANAQGAGGLFPSNTALLEVDPMFQGLASGDCASNLWLDVDSPARDAGDPSIEDVDGGRSDIGAYGGPDSDLTDLDADGFLSDLDCDELDPAVNPGVPDIPYDGIDNDCDGADLCDGDGDGFDATECGGRDCDDRDPAVNPRAHDKPDDGVDNDCDGFQPRTWLSGGAGCSADHTGGLPVAGWAAALLLIGLRRRE